MSRSDDRERSWLDNSAVSEVLKEHLDETDYQIYRALNENGRMSDTELGEQVGLSRTAARRRREILQEEGIIDVLAVLILQEAELAYADVRLSFTPDATVEEMDVFVEELLHEEQIYEIDEYMGRYDLLVRVWHASLQDVKRYVNERLQNTDIVESFETTPVVKTRKAWHKIINGPESD